MFKSSVGIGLKPHNWGLQKAVFTKWMQLFCYDSNLCGVLIPCRIKIFISLQGQSILSLVIGRFTNGGVLVGHIISKVLLYHHVNYVKKRNVNLE